MDNAALWLAIKARAAADTTAGGLFASGANLVSGVYPNVGPADTNLPFIVFDVADIAPRHAFAKDIFEGTVRFNIYVPTRGLNDPHARASAIIQRVYGNWVSSAPSTAPTYGYHRHKLVIASGNWTAGHLSKTGAFIEHDDGMLHFVEEYSLLLSA